MSPFTQAFYFVQFSLGFLFHSFQQQPLVLVALLGLLAASLLAWRLLTTCSLPSFLSSPVTCLVLLVAAVALVQQSVALQAQVVEVEAALEDSRWALRQGQEHRVALLRRLAAREQVDQEVPGQAEANPLDGCLHVFLDLGSNRGLQIRKLYEPHLFPLAPVLPLYERYFGPPEKRNLQEICAVGFEPNAKHTEHLQALAANYSTCGIKVVMFTETGVSDKDAVGSFAADLTLKDDAITHDGGARFLPTDQTLESLKQTHALGGSEVVEVKLMRVAKFITEVVATRRLPLSAEVEKPRVVAKVDIEGSELQVVTDMVLTGALAVVDNLHMEWHGVHGPGITREGAEAEMIDLLAPAITSLGELTARLGMEEQFLVEELDDETYSGVSVYGVFGDYSLLPTPVC